MLSYGHESMGGPLHRKKNARKDREGNEKTRKDICESK
jgi:hypothetical protein